MLLLLLLLLLNIVCPFREGSANSDMGSRASLRDDDIAQAEVVVESARHAVGELMRKIEQVQRASIAHTKLSRLVYAALCATSVAGSHRTAVSAYNCIFASHILEWFQKKISEHVLDFPLLPTSTRIERCYRGDRSRFVHITLSCMT